jgi:hypothetical protein
MLTPEVAVSFDASPTHLYEIAEGGLRITAATFIVRVDTFGTAGVIQARTEHHGCV